MSSSELDESPGTTTGIESFDHLRFSEGLD